MILLKLDRTSAPVFDLSKLTGRALISVIFKLKSDLLGPPREQTLYVEAMEIDDGWEFNMWLDGFALGLFTARGLNFHPALQNCLKQHAAENVKEVEPS